MSPETKELDQDLKDLVLDSLMKQYESQEIATQAEDYVSKGDKKSSMSSLSLKKSVMFEPKGAVSFVDVGSSSAQVIEGWKTSYGPGGFKAVQRPLNIEKARRVMHMKKLMASDSLDAMASTTQVDQLLKGMHKRSKTKTTAALGVFANATLPFDKKLKRKTASVGKARLAKIPKKKEKSLLTLNMAQTAGADAFNIASEVNGDSPNGRNTKLTETLNE